MAFSTPTYYGDERKNDRFGFVGWLIWVAVISAKNHKRQSVTAKREKSQTPKVLTAILILPNLA